MPLDASFVKRWTLTNTLAHFVGFLLYTPIGHGLTGSHGRDMTNPQLIAHTIALMVVAGIVLLMQRRVIGSLLHITIVRIVIGIVAFPAMFWFGYYLQFLPDGPDYDILFAFLVLGCGSWIGLVSFSKNKWRWIVAVLAFPFASFIGELLLFLVVMAAGLELDVQDEMVHAIFFLTVGVTTGLLGGFVTGKMLRKMLPPE